MKKQNNSIVKISNSLTSSPQSNSLSKRGLSDMGISSEIENLINKMDMYIRNEEYEKAIVIDKKILSIDPANIRANFNLGFCNQRLKRYDKAIEYYNKTLSLDKNHLLALTNKAMCLDDSGRTTEALEMYDEILKLGLENSNKSVIASALFNLKRYEQCIKICDEILDENPIDWDGLFYKAFALMKTKNYSRAIVVAEELLSIQPSNIYALNIIGEVYLLTKNYKESLKTYNLILEINPNDPQALEAIRRIADSMEGEDISKN